jgi:hypothetical protein
MKRNSRNKYEPSQRLALPRRAFRTSVGNGNAILNGVDGRSLIARRYKEVGATIAADLASDPSELTEAQHQLIRTASGLIVLREDLDVKIVNGQQVDVAEYTHIANGLRRLLTTLGLKREARDVTPSVADYVKHINAQEEADA